MKDHGISQEVCGTCGRFCARHGCTPDDCKVLNRAARRAVVPAPVEAPESKAQREANEKFFGGAK
jgi:hypothetical protein